MADVLAMSDRTQADPDADRRLLDELLDLLTQLEQGRARLAEAPVEQHGVVALEMVAAAVNSLIAFVTARCSDRLVLPSRVLARMADVQPYTQLLGEEDERITVSTATAMLRSWNGSRDDQRRMLQELCRALLDVMAAYGQTAGTFFRVPREREEWRATFELFVEDLRTAMQRFTG